MAKIEPTVITTARTGEAFTFSPIPPEPVPVAPMPVAEGVPAAEPRKLDQLSRIEDKAARIEEKFARYEAVLTRAEAGLERSSQKVDQAASAMDFAGLRDELAALRARVDATPRFGALMLTGLVTAVLAAALTYAVIRFGLPVLPR